MRQGLGITGVRAGRANRSRAGWMRGSWVTWQATLIGTAAVAIIDGLDAVIFSGMRGVPPMRLFQAIAFSVLGPDTYSYGLSSALLGVLLHISVAFGIVSVYVQVSRWMPALRKYPFVFGLSYGIVVWLVMNFVILPLTRIGVPRLSGLTVVNGILIHMLGVGLPAAHAASRIRRR
jgi:uncharacterized membrane protein YagU involved in acid resistance